MEPPTSLDLSLAFSLARSLVESRLCHCHITWSERVQLAAVAGDDDMFSRVSVEHEAENGDV